MNPATTSIFMEEKQVKEMDELPLGHLPLSRPVTPIDEEIKARPPGLDQLQRLVRRRIMAKPDVPFLSVEDQRDLAAVLMGEVSSFWSEIKRLIFDSFLTAEENKELNRRIVVHVVKVCEKLFQCYLRKAQVLNGRGVFSGPANTSRLKVQLALEAHELLNILKIRRQIVNDLRVTAAEKITNEEKLRKLIPDHIEADVDPIWQDMTEIQEAMPILDSSSLIKLLANVPYRKKQMQHAEVIQIKQVPHLDDKYSSVEERKDRSKVQLQRCQSLPLFKSGEDLLQELGIDPGVKVDRGRELNLFPRKSSDLSAVLVRTQDKESLLKEPLGQRYLTYIEQDLHDLTAGGPRDFFDVTDELPPLLQAVVCHSRNDDNLKQKLEEQLNELERRQKTREIEESVTLEEAAIPQPDTVITKFGHSNTVQTSDVRVSNRVSMSKVTLKPQDVVYNDLLDEIDPVVLNNLDSHLFLGDEIMEVYQEIMKTLPKNHLELDNDSSITTCPDSLNMINTTTSARLRAGSAGRAVNPAFKQGVDGQDTDTGNHARALNPAFKQGVDGQDTDTGNHARAQMSGTNSFKSVLVTPLNQNMKGKADAMEHRGMISGVGRRSAQSSVSSQDYMKYLSTQETHFLGAIFHLYDSEEEDDSETSSEANLLNTQKQAEMKKLIKLKSEFQKGFWNANAVLMGGLGKDPDVTDGQTPAHNIQGGQGFKGEFIELKKAEGDKGGKIPEKVDSEGVVLATIGGSQVGQSRKLKTETAADQQSEVKRKQKTETAADQQSEDKSSNVQDRLELVWQQLQMSDSQRLNMAIKYSCDPWFSHVTEIVEQWEQVTRLILQRETLLAQLAGFELQASDPNRFFAKESKNSIFRFEEAKQRANYSKRIDILDTKIREALEPIQTKFRDIVTYKGRPYLDKLRWDRTELLYYHAEERKLNGLKYEELRLNGFKI